MTTFSGPKILKKHIHREIYNNCPHCGKPLKWITDGLYWYPCDHEPVLFMMHPTGKMNILYRRQLLLNCLIYKPGDKRFTGQPLTGYIQHFYTCDFLKKQREMFRR